jgi:inorganic pyrophosphatase
MAGIVFVCVDGMAHYFTTTAFVIGAVTSMFCGAFGMKIATYSNFRTTLEAKRSLGAAFKTAFRAGCVMGFTLVSVSIMVLTIVILVYKDLLGIG